ncbi:MAG TPA: cobalamin-independent methionine synthase II family protein [Dehalococcoidia bacterium]|nr:cobalamin-independent methionine synthase II family protein [Dehalococcoidia bacterium]
MNRSSGRILTTHVGSLPRPADLLDAMRERYGGGAYDGTAFDSKVREAVNDVVARQVALGIDVVADGEQGKLGFYAYVRERLAGFEPGEKEPMEVTMGRSKEVRAFPEYYNRYFAKRAGPRIGDASTPVKCTGPISYKGQAALAADIANLKAAMASAGATQGFMPAVAPRGVGRNEYYNTEEEYVEAVANAMHEEYAAIVDAGLMVQLDDAWLTSLYGQDDVQDIPAARREAEKYVEVLNHSLRGLPAEMVRFHTCYGINEGPRVYDVPFEEIIGLMLKVDAGAYSFEFGNPRHEHEWHLWERFKLPDGKKIMPGVITHSTNVVEHPEVVAERLCNFASVVGRDNVIASADCGFSSNASYETDIPLIVVWEKFKSLAEGAAIASKRLWS